MDDRLLLWINRDWAHPLLDPFFATLSARLGFAFPLMGLVLVLMVWRWRTDGARLWLVWGIVIGLGDLGGNLLKDLLDQPRPCFDLAAQVRMLDRPLAVACGDSLTGMPSNHALNYFTAATFLAVALRGRLYSWVLSVVAVLVAVSRIYLGKHYPSQVLAGAGLGAVWGALAAYAALRWLPVLRRVRDHVRGASSSG